MLIVILYRCLRLLSLYTSLTILMAAPLYGEQLNKKTHPISVVASISPLGSIVSEICQESCTVKTLLSGRVDLHSFEAKPTQLKDIADSELVVFNGGGFESWAKGSLPIYGDKVIQLSNFSDTLGEDPHFWLDLQRVGNFTEDLTNRLCALRVSSCDSFKVYSKEFKEKLSLFDQEYKKAFDSLEEKAFLAYHPAWTHFARHFSLTQLSVLGHDEMQQPSPNDIARSIELGKSGKVRVLVVEPATPITTLDTLIESGGFKVVLLDPLGEDGESYINLMRRNCEALYKALTIDGK